MCEFSVGGEGFMLKRVILKIFLLHGEGFLSKMWRKHKINDLCEVYKLASGLTEKLSAKIRKKVAENVNG